MIFLLISIFIFLSYALLIIAITIGWFRLKGFKTPEIQSETKVSIIVAVRNEEPNIESLLNSLFHQDYSPSFFEIIVVDDHSVDSTVEFIEEWIAKLDTGISYKIIRLNEASGEGKKTAINAGIKSSNGELIVITDADCTAGKSWITTLAAFYDKHKPQMILGPVRMSEGVSLFGKLQSLEFTSLISSTAGSCNVGFPLLANGANIAFTRRTYESCGGFDENIQYPSGDDMFLMLSIKRKSGAKSIRFLRSEEAIVSTPALKGLNPFIQQRLRWVSKSRGYTDPLLIAVSLLVFCANFLLVTTGFFAILFPEYLKLFLFLFLSKLIIDLPLMFSFSRFQRSTNLMWLFPVLQLLNAVYTTIIGIAGNFGKYEWKGRQIVKNAYK